MVIPTRYLYEPDRVWASCSATNVGTLSVTVYMEFRGIDKATGSQISNPYNQTGGK